MFRGDPILQVGVALPSGDTQAIQGFCAGDRQLSDSPTPIEIPTCAEVIECCSQWELNTDLQVGCEVDASL